MFLYSSISFSVQFFGIVIAFPHTKALIENGLVIKKESHDFNVLYFEEAKPIGVYFNGINYLFIDDSGEAPVPPLSPLINTTSPCPFETPAAMVPTPASDTNLTCILDSGLAFLRS